jgi:glucuronate isomerase
MTKNNNFIAFKKFLSEECWSEKEYGDGKYDKKIYDYFHKTPEKIVNNNFIEEVEKELSKVFDFESVFGENSMAKKLLSNFISQKLQEQKEELKKEIVEMIEEYVGYLGFGNSSDDFNNMLKDLISKIKNI